MHPSHLAFSHLKRLVSIERVLTARGMIASLKPHGQRLIGPCPVHHGDHPQAFVVDLAKDLWHCFTRCRGGGDVVELVRRMDHCQYPEVARYLASLAQASPTPARAEARAPDRAYQPYTRELRLNPHAPLLAQKGIWAQTARHFEAGAYLGPGFLQRCVAIRLHDPDGRPIGYAGRRLDPEQIRQYGKWKFPPGLPKREILYGFHRITSRLHQALAVVECPWGVMRLAQIGMPAVALLGIHLSCTQAQLLRRTPRIVLMLDGDQAGRAARSPIPSTTTPVRRCIGSTCLKASTPTISTTWNSRAGLFLSCPDTHPQPARSPWWPRLPLRQLMGIQTHRSGSEAILFSLLLALPDLPAVFRSRFL